MRAAGGSKPALDPVLHQEHAGQREGHRRYDIDPIRAHPRDEPVQKAWAGGHRLGFGRCSGGAVRDRRGGFGPDLFLRGGRGDGLGDGRGHRCLGRAVLKRGDAVLQCADVAFQADRDDNKVNDRHRDRDDRQGHKKKQKIPHRVDHL